MSYHGPRENGEGRVSEGGHDRARDPTITNIPNVSIPTPLRLAWGLSTPNTAAEPEVTTTGSPSILDLSLTTRTPYFRCIYGTISSHASTAYYSSRHTWSTTWYWEGFHGIRTGYYWCTSSRTATLGQNTKSSWSLHIIFPEHLSVRDSPSLEIAGTPLLMTYEYLEAFYQDSHFVKKSFSDRSDAWIEISWVVTVDFQWFPDFFFQSYIIRLLGSNLWRLFRCSEFDVRWKTNFKIFSNSTRFPNKWKEALNGLGYDCTLTFGLAFSSMQMLDQRIQKFWPPGEEDTTSPTCARIRALWSKCNTIHTSSPIPAVQTFPPTPPSTPTPSTMTSSSNWHENLPPKLSPEDMTTMKTQFEKNHPGEILDFHSTPSVRLWSLVHQHKINKAIKYIPIRRRLCHDRD